MPVISADHEMDGQDFGEDAENEEGSMQLGENGQEGAAAALKKRKSQASSKHEQEDSKMAADDGEVSESSEDSRTPEERLRDEEIDKDYEKDIKLMESLFPDEHSKTKRLLATLEGH